ncbi:hypothetical protein OXIME_000923 [Oxyplasma meridianum]|uniref:Uncharacterized protein n=1 Tax=Oxyplasma meridianum TaxID=3073602 RepID=A0AAX4NHZ7_9ARCH
MIIIALDPDNIKQIKGYTEKDVVEYISSYKPERILCTIGTGNGDISPTVQGILDEPEIKQKLKFVGVDNSKYSLTEAEYMKKNSDRIDFQIKRNVLEMIDTSIRSFLEGYWNSPETVNSDLTDTMYKAKHRLRATIFYDLEEATWENRNESILNNIRSASPGRNEVLLCTLEERYWFNEKLSVF